jgi:hypothetical protein
MSVVISLREMKSLTRSVRTTLANYFVPAISPARK